MRAAAANNGTNNAKGAGQSSAQYSTVPGSKTRQAANTIVNGGKGSNKPLANGQRNGVGAARGGRSYGAAGNSGMRGASRGRAQEEEILPSKRGAQGSVS